MTDTVSEIFWLRELLIALGVVCSAVIPLHCDSLSAIHLSVNLFIHERTKHVELNCHFLRDEIILYVIS